MKILLLGSGGREHALAWKIAQSKKCEKLFIAPGNAGTGLCGENVNMKADDFEAIKDFIVANGVNMVVVGPEDPLVKGIYDNLKADARTKDIPVIGPSKAGAVLEGSKDFRVHSADMGHPVCGDPKYGNGDDPLHRLCLHAWLLCFHHPVTGEPMEFETPVPTEFRKMFK